MRLAWQWLKHKKKPLWLVADGAYAKREVLDAARRNGITVVSRLCKDEALQSVPEPPPKGQRGRPRRYGSQKIRMAKRAGQKSGWTTDAFVLYGQKVTKTYKTLLATWGVAGGVLRVVLVKEDDGWRAYFCTDPNATVADIMGMVADPNSLEQIFKDVKEVCGAGQQ